MDIEDGKSCFINRQAGFKIKISGGKNIELFEGINYESTANQIAAVKVKWKKLQDAVYEKWQADKTELPILKL